MNNFILLITSWYLSCNYFLLLSSEVCGLTYYGLRQDCEGMSWYFLILESIVDTYRLTTVGNFTILICITWFICHVWWVFYPVEGMLDSVLSYVPCDYAWSSVMNSGEVWGSGPGVASWEPGSSGSSWQLPILKGMLEESLISHSFARVKFYCGARYEWSSTRFYQLPGIFSSLCDTQWRIFLQIPHDTDGKNDQFYYLGLMPLILNGKGNDPGRTCP